MSLSCRSVSVLIVDVEKSELIAVLISRSESLHLRSRLEYVLVSMRVLIIVRAVRYLSLFFLRRFVSLTRRCCRSESATIIGLHQFIPLIFFPAGDISFTVRKVMLQICFNSSPALISVVL